MVSTCTSFLPSIFGVDSLRVSRLPRCRARLVALCLVLASMACGGWSAATAQTAHFAGTQSVVANAATSGLSEPSGVAVDGSGNVYIADTNNNRVLKETLSAGVYTQTVIASAPYHPLNIPQGVAVDGSGNVYISDSINNRVLKETLSAGRYIQSVVADYATHALSYPEGVAVDGSGNVYFADYGNDRVLKETPSAGGYTQTVVANYTSNGVNGPTGVAVDGSGNVYITGYVYKAPRDYATVFKETLSAGGYTQSVIANSANNGLKNPYGVAVDGSGNVYIADYGDNQVLKETLSAGSYTQSVITSAATNGQWKPLGIALDGSGNVYITDSENNRVLKETSSSGFFGTVSVGSTSPAPITMIFTFDTAGTLGSTAVVTQGATGLDFTNPGTGTCKAGTAYTAGESCTVDVSFTPRFGGMRYGAAELLDGSGNVLATGHVQGTGAEPLVNFLHGIQSVVANAATNGLLSSEGVTVDGSGNVYIADTSNNRVLKETLSAGVYAQTVIANAANNGLSVPIGIAVDGGGNVYIADVDNNRVLKETLSAGSYTQTVLADSATNGLFHPHSVAVDGSGNVYITDYSGNGRVVKETLSAGSYTQTVVANNANDGLIDPWGVAVDGDGNVYVADTFNSRVLMETLSASGYTQSVVANAANNGLVDPAGVAVDESGNVYIADFGTNLVLKEKLSAGAYTQTTLANSAANGLNHPEGVALDGGGHIYIADANNSRVLEEDFGVPPSLTFAATAVGLTSSDSPQTVKLMNNGNAALILPVPATGSNPSISANFTLNSSVASACPLVNSKSSAAGILPAGASCLLSIGFVPTTMGTLAGSLVLTDNNLNQANSTQTIALAGTGAPPPVVSLSATSLSFGLVQAGATSASQSVTLTNTGPAELLIAGIAVTGTDATSFVFANNCGTSLAVKASCTIQGQFAPEAPGAMTAAITITDNAASSPQSITLSGTGAAPIASLSATSLSFGTVAVGKASASQSVTLTNTGNAALTITGIAVTGSGAASFVFVNNCGTSLAAGAGCTIHGHFAPAVSGALTAAIAITDNASGSPQKIRLSGTGATTVSLSVTSLSFGPVGVGATSVSKSFTLTNTGAGALSIASIELTGADADSFAFSNNCGKSLPVKASCTIHGHFAPAAAGALTADLTITGNVIGSPQSVALSGTGEVAIASLSATSLSFGKEAVGKASASQSVTLSNIGNEALAITSIAVTGADASSFDFVNNCGTSLAPKASCTIHGHFAPTAAGAMNADLSIKDNADNSPQSIALSGTGQ